LQCLKEECDIAINALQTVYAREKGRLEEACIIAHEKAREEEQRAQSLREQMRGLEEQLAAERQVNEGLRYPDLIMDVMD
jgi:hypothetical protein